MSLSVKSHAWWSIVESAALGALVGALIGLSTSPVVSSALGAVLAIATALFLHAAPQAGGPAPDVGDSRPKAVATFAVVALTTTLIAMSVRTHSALSPSISHDVKQWIDAGYGTGVARAAVLRQRAGLVTKDWAPTEPTSAGLSVLYGAKISEEIGPLNPTRYKTVADALRDWQAAGGDWKNVADAVADIADQGTVGKILRRYWEAKDKEKLQLAGSTTSLEARVVSANH
jgi:hypothetical protein